MIEIVRLLKNKTTFLHFQFDDYGQCSGCYLLNKIVTLCQFHL